MALTVSKESALMEAGNSVLASSVFHRLAGNFWLVRVRTYTASADIRASGEC